MPVPTCLRKFVAEALPKLPKRPGKFRDMLAADAAAQKVLASYADKLQAWHQRFVESAKGGAALYAHWESQLQAVGSLEKKSISIDPAGNLHSNLSALQARLAFIDAHDAEDFALGTFTPSPPTLSMAIARCPYSSPSPSPSL